MSFRNDGWFVSLITCKNSFMFGGYLYNCLYRSLKNLFRGFDPFFLNPSLSYFNPQLFCTYGVTNLFLKIYCWFTFLMPQSNSMLFVCCVYQGLSQIVLRHCRCYAWQTFYALYRWEIIVVWILISFSILYNQNGLKDLLGIKQKITNKKLNELWLNKTCLFHGKREEAYLEICIDFNETWHALWTGILIYQSRLNL